MSTHTTQSQQHQHHGKTSAVRPATDDTIARGAIKDPKDWTTGDEPMTGAQESYLDTLAREAGERVDGDLTKAEASEKIDELRKALAEKDLKALVAFNESPVAKRARDATPGALAAAMSSLGNFDYKGNVRAAFCRKTGKGCDK